MRNIRFVRIIFATLAVLGGALAVLAHFEPRFPGDLPVSLWFQSFHGQWLLDAMKGISYVTGDWRGAVIAIVGGIIFWKTRGGLESIALIFSGAISAINGIFKIVIGRPRPEADLVNVFVVETGKSFPSGHTFFSVVVLGMMAYLIIIHQTKHYQKVLTASLFIVFILLIGISRIYLGVHWTSDVIGGYIIGFLFLALEIWLYSQLKRRLVNSGKIIERLTVNGN